MLGSIIMGERVKLAPPSPEMLETFNRWFADREVTRYLGGTYPQSLKAEQEWFDKMASSDKQILWATFAIDGDNERLIGTTDVTVNWKHRNAATGNLIGEKSEWGKGYGSEIVQLRTDWAFSDLPIEKLTSSTFAENVGSRRVLEKAGYQTVGTARREIWRHNRWHDAWLCEILRDDWEARRVASGR